MAQSPRFEAVQGFAQNEGGAAFGNPNFTRQGIKSGATQATPSAPAKAPAAPKPNTSTAFTGLFDALNANQQKLQKDGTYELADEYYIEFAPDTISQATLKKAGPTNQAATAAPPPTTAKSAKDPATNKMSTDTRTVSVSAGMQIIQFIDQVIKSSSYISDQANFVVTEGQNGEGSKTLPNPNNVGGQVAWYKVSVRSEQKGFDKKRNDFAYKMTFVISSYGLNSVPSEYFPRTAFRGVHKNYQYWFTGQNSAVINYEQNLDALYTKVMSGEDLIGPNETRFDRLERFTWVTRSEQSDQGAKGKANEPAASLADGLYNYADFAECKLKIVGDPAWIPQGEVSGGLTAETFSFAPFLNDGTINVDASQATFSLTFQQPSDYDFDTGMISNRNTQNTMIEPVNPVYYAKRCVSTFSKGRFEQDLEGILIPGIDRETPKDQIRQPNPAVNTLPAAAPTSRPGFANTGGGAAVGNPRLTAQGVRAGATQQITDRAVQTQDALGNPSTGAQQEPVGNQAPPKQPTSSGGIGPGAGSGAPNQAPAPPNADSARNADPVVLRQLNEAENTLATYTTNADGTPRMLNPGSLMARRAANQQLVVAELRSKLTATQTPVNTNPQVMRKDQ
jgi:hypothetical protein